MKRWIWLMLVTPMLFLVIDVNAQHRRDSHGPAPRDGAQQRRPAEHWLESIRQEDPQEFERLKKLRQESPETFSSELRKRIRERMTDRLLAQNPKLHDFVNSLPPEKRELLMDAFRQLAAGERGGGGQQIRPDGERPRHRAESHRTPHENSTSDTAERMPNKRAELEKTYDKRTQMIEQSIERIRRQLEGLERMLDERKSRREEIISTSESM